MIEKIRKSRIASVMMVVMLLASMSGAFTMESVAQTVALKDYQAMQVAATPDQADVPADEADVPAETDPAVPMEEEGSEADAPEGSGAKEEVPAEELAPASRNMNISIAAVPGTGDPAFYCDFRNLPAQGDVATWWANNNVAPDCINFNVVVDDATCSLTVTMSSYVFSSVSGNPATWNDSFAWYETDSAGKVLRPEGGGPPLNWQSAGGVDPTGKTLTATFPEDYKDGTAYVLVNFGSPENQIQPGLSQSDINHWRTTSAGVVYTVNTDCEEPVPVNYCDYSQLVGAGDVYNWLADAPEGALTDCFTVGTPVQACGSLNIPFSETVVPFAYTLYWAEGTTIPADDSLWKTTWPITFGEDYSDGSVDVIVFVGGPEDDYYHFGGADLGKYPYPYPNIDRGDIPARSLGGGVPYTIDTDCVDPVPVNYCDYSQIDTVYGVYAWLDAARDAGVPAADLDCIDVGPPAQVCGSLNIPFSETVDPFGYQLYWAVGTTIPADDSLWKTTWPITFPEDHNGGSVDVIVFIGGAEDDYYHFADLGKYPYPYPNVITDGIPVNSLGGGVQFTINTNCQIPVTPSPTPTETPVVTPTETPVVTPTETPVTPVVTPTETPVTPAPTAPVVTTLPSTGAGDDAGNSTMIWLTLAGISMLVVAGLGIRRNQVR